MSLKAWSGWLPEHRVAITGMGAVSCFGCGVVPFWDAVSRGRSGIRPVEGFDQPFRFSNGAQVSGYIPAEHFDDKRLTLLDRYAQYALVATREAVRMSGRTRFDAIVTGCSAGGQDAMDAAFVDLYKRNSPRVNPMMVPRVMSSGAASHIAMEFDVTGPVYSVSTACSSANHAIGQAYQMVRTGMCEAAFAGGCEAVFSYGFLKAWEAMRVVSPDTCRPFSVGRQGMILGEGAAMFVLESLDAARARGATVYGEIVGFGMSCDAHHITQPTVEGPVRAMRAAGLERVDYINAHGTGTAANDSTEAAAIRFVFGDAVAVSSTKSMHGHALGAAGALEAVATAMALRDGVIPPTANFIERDPACDIDVVANEPRRRAMETALSNSFAFGGLNAVLAFRNPDAL
jgi:nodulation protein E